MGISHALIMLGAVAGLSMAQGVRAEWYEARTRQFIVYSNDKQDRVREMAERLDRFASLIRVYHATPEPEGGDQNPVTIYVTASLADIQKLARRGVAGFYIGRASGPIAYTTRGVGGGGGDGELGPQVVLFHEYAHHFLLGNYAQAYPAWFSEGYAEFVSTARISDTTAILGYAADHRGYGMVTTDGLSLKELLAPPSRTLSVDEIQSLYGRGWLLTHYLMSDAARRRQLAAYLRAFQDGTPSLEAAQAAFGDLGALNNALTAYRKSSRLTGYGRPLSSLPPPNAVLRALSPGEAQMMPLRMMSDRGVDAKEAKSLHMRGQAIAARFPDDAIVQGWFAELAHDAGQYDDADAAADRTIAADPRSVQGLLYKGRVGMARAAEAKNDPAAWTRARAWIIKANKVANDDAGALLLFYQSFQIQGATPTKSAVAGLHRAFELVPQDPQLRWTVVRQYLGENDTASAASALRPLAFASHGSRNGNVAATALEQIAAGRPAAEILATIDAPAKAATETAAR